MSVAPDYVEPLVGWRVWVVRREDETVRLHSVVYDTAWPPRRELVADCLRCPSLLPRRFRSTHESPLARCQCGIYATSESESLADYLEGFRPFEPELFQRIFGRVFLWGTVVGCEHGWRASRAYPAHLYVPARGSGRAGLPVEEVALGLRDYRVPIEIVEWETGNALARVLAEVGDRG